jgi:hypothetical protein
VVTPFKIFGWFKEKQFYPPHLTLLMNDTSAVKMTNKIIAPVKYEKCHSSNTNNKKVVFLLSVTSGDSGLRAITLFWPYAIAPSLKKKIP